MGLAVAMRLHRCAPMYDTRLAARLALRGVEALSDAELLAVVCGWPVDESQRLLDGDPPTRPRGDDPQMRITALLSLARRRDRPTPELPTLDSAAAVAALLFELGHAEVEELHALALDSRNRLVRRVVVARGAVNQVATSAREVFRPLVLAGATRAIVVHNHPSGDAQPSPEDRQLTRRLGAAGDLLGIALLDHVIIASGGYFSFAEEIGSPLRLKGARRANR